MYLVGPHNQIDQGAIVQHPVFTGVYPNSAALVLTPRCDFEQGNAEFLTLCAVLPPSDLFDRQGWSEAERRRNLADIASSSRSPRWYRLWKELALPGCMNGALLDFQLIASVGENALDGLPVLAMIAAPWTEDIGARYAAYAGRVGVPDPPPDKVSTEARNAILVDYTAGLLEGPDRGRTAR